MVRDDSCKQTVLAPIVVVVSTFGPDAMGSILAVIVAATNMFSGASSGDGGGVAEAVFGVAVLLRLPLE